MAGQYQEGQRLLGSDGQTYVVRNGQPVREQAARTPGSIGPSPTRQAIDQAERDRQAGRDRLAANSDARAAASEARAAAKDKREREIEDGVAAPGDINKTGEEYLATLPAPMRAQVKAMAEGRTPYPVGAALRSPKTQQLLAATLQYDPTYSAADSITRVATRKKWTSGAGANNVTAANTALGHLGTLWKATQDLNNGSVVPWNAVVNSTESTFGDPRIKNYTMARDAVANELMKVFRGPGGSMTEVEEWKQNMGSADSKEQQKAVIQQGIALLNSRLQAMATEYNQGMGHDFDPLQFLNPHAREVFDHLGPGGDMILPTAGGPGNGSDGPSGPAPPPLSINEAAANGWQQAAVAEDGAARVKGQIAQGQTRYDPDPETAQHMWDMWKAGKSQAEIIGYAGSQGYQFVPWGPKREKDNVTRNKMGLNPFQSGKDVPVSWRDKAGAQPLASFATAAGNAATGGMTDEIYGGLNALVGNDYTTARDHFQGIKEGRAELNQKSNLLGNFAGGVGAVIGGGAAARGIGSLAGRLAPEAVAAIKAAPLAAKVAPALPLAGDVAYGAGYGAGENNQDRIGGAVSGAGWGLLGGVGARAAGKGLSGLIAPKGGAVAPLYDTGSFPTIGQRLSAANGGKGFTGALGRSANTLEQALQSVPLLGGFVARARNIPRQQWQVGGFNSSLEHLAPFGDLPTSLPGGVGPGTQAHSIAGGAFDAAYDRARSGMNFAPDQGYIADIGNFGKTLDSGLLSEGQAAQVKKLLNNTVGSRLQASGGSLPGDAYKQASSELSAARAKWGRSPETAHMADALGDYQTIFDNAARRSSDPASVALLDAADSGYAKLVRIQRASELGGVKKEDGTFTPTTLAQADKSMSGGVRSNAWNKGQGLMQDYIGGGKYLEDTLGNSGSAERLMTGQLVAGGAGGIASALGAPLAHPGALGLLAPYVPGINHAVTRMIAPNNAALRPNLAAFLAASAGKIDRATPIAGRLAIPAVVNWNSQ